MTRFLPLSAFLLLISCQEITPYQSKGFGSVNGGPIGNSSSLVTISGSVMSNATFRSTSFLFGLSSLISALSGKGPIESMIESIGPDNDCANATWAMTYLGGGSKIVASGTVDGTGAFQVPSVASGKEGIITFNCSSGTQKCIAKGGDNGLNCNAIADGVVGALQAALGSSLTSSQFGSKSIAKIANAIVDNANGEEMDSMVIQEAMEECKAITNQTQRNNCYKVSLEESSASGTFATAKTLAQQWSVENLLNFVVGTAGFNIYGDSLIFTEFGERLDEWLETDFVAQVRLYLQKLSDPAQNAELPVRLKCQLQYTKYQSWGEQEYTPKVVNGAPTCYNEDQLEALLGIPKTTNGPFYTQLEDAISNNNNSDMIQAASGHPDNCSDYNASFNTQGTYCIRPPNMIIMPKTTEANRNDPEGRRPRIHPPYSDLIEVLRSVIDRIIAMQAESDDVASTYHNCMTTPSGTPIIVNNAICMNWAKQNFQSLKNEFSGIFGLYMYLKMNTGKKLSLATIHKLFSKSNLFNAKLTAPSYGQYSNKEYHWSEDGDSGTRWIDPVLDVSDYRPLTDANPNVVAKMMDIFIYDPNASNEIVEADYEDVNTRGSLFNHYAMTFAPFEKIRSNTELQVLVNSLSHHENENPYGSKYSNVSAIERNSTLYPIFCRMTDRTGKPVLKALGSDVKISCLPNPEDFFDFIGGKFVLKVGKINYPYLLVERGSNGDDKGRLFNLADRKTGQLIRVSHREIQILENNNNNSIISGTCNDASTDPAPLVNTEFSWRDINDKVKSEIITAYCLDMNGIVSFDDRTRPYRGKMVEVTSNENKYRLNRIGGILNGGNSLIPSDICIKFATSPFTENYYSPGTWTTVNTGDGFSASQTIGSLTYDVVTSLANSNSEINFCDELQGTKYYFNEIWHDTIYQASTAARDNLPLMLHNYTTNAPISNIAITINAIEAKVNSLKVANSIPISYLNNLMLLNQKHDPKFDPYCDDRNNNGFCDCYEGTTTTPRSNQAECTLLDTTAEPTISDLWYYSDQKYRDFFNAFAGKAGDDIRHSNNDPLTSQWFHDEELYFRFEEVFVCQYKVLGEEFYRRPSADNFNAGATFTNTDFVGCPESDGDLSNGGPVRVINPVAMRNAFDIRQPKTFLTMMNYATKSLTRSDVLLDKDAEVFTFDEAFALMYARMLMPPKNIIVTDEGGNNIPSITPYFDRVRVSERNNVSLLTSILIGLTDEARPVNDRKLPVPGPYDPTTP